MEDQFYYIPISATAIDGVTDKKRAVGFG